MGLVNLTPDFDIPELTKFKGRITQITAQDISGYSSDAVTIHINMQDKVIDDLPKSGSDITLKMGWLESGLLSMGKFTISNIKPQFKPKMVVITALASPFNANPKNETKLRRSETYENKTINDIVTACAQRMELTPRVHADFQSLTIEHIDQKNETDLSFLQRLSIKFDAVVKPVDGKLVFSRKGQEKTLSGEAIPIVELQHYNGNKAPYNALLQVSFDLPERSQFLGLRADWYDIDNAEIVRLEHGQEPFKQLAGRFKSAETAYNSIHAELRRMDREGVKVNFTVAGNPSLMAEGVINLSGFDDDRLGGQYSIDTVTHSFIAKQSFKTMVTASALVE